MVRGDEPAARQRSREAARPGRFRDQSREDGDRVEVRDGPSFSQPVDEHVEPATTMCMRGVFTSSGRRCARASCAPGKRLRKDCSRKAPDRGGASYHLRRPRRLASWNPCSDRRRPEQCRVEPTHKGSARNDRSVANPGLRDHATQSSTPSGTSAQTVRCGLFSYQRSFVDRERHPNGPTDALAAQAR
jgi:hypothetical protein